MAAKTKLPPTKIFVIEDDPIILEYLENTLEDFGYKVASCSKGSEVQAKMDGEKIDLILMDVMLPDTDGITLCRQLHSNDKTSGIPIIMLTCLSDSNTIRDAFAFGAVDFIAKPFTRANLKSRIQKALSKK